MRTETHPWGEVEYHTTAGVKGYDTIPQTMGEGDWFELGVSVRDGVLRLTGKWKDDGR